MRLILASTSIYRQQQLSKVGISFETIKPLIDEESLKAELTKKPLSPFELAEEISFQKGFSVYKKFENEEHVIVLSGDQLVQSDKKVLGKPETHEKAFEQLKSLQNNSHQLITSLTLFNKKQVIRHTEVVQLRMRSLTDAEINNYLLKDKPYDCAGSYKIEKSAIALFETITCHDFSAIQGIPMIWLCNKLKEFQYEFFKY